MTLVLQAQEQDVETELENCCDKKGSSSGSIHRVTGQEVTQQKPADIDAITNLAIFDLPSTRIVPGSNKDHCYQEMHSKHRGLPKPPPTLA